MKTDLEFSKIRENETKVRTLKNTPKKINEEITFFFLNFKDIYNSLFQKYLMVKESLNQVEDKNEGLVNDLNHYEENLNFFNKINEKYQVNCILYYKLTEY